MLYNIVLVSAVYQHESVAQSVVSDSASTLGFPVHHQLPELVQTLRAFSGTWVSEPSGTELQVVLTR